MHGSTSKFYEPVRSVQTGSVSSLGSPQAAGLHGIFHTRAFRWNGQGMNLLQPGLCTATDESSFPPSAAYPNKELFLKTYQ